VLLGLWAGLTVGRLAWHTWIGGPGAYYFTPIHATGLLLGSAFALHPIRGRLGGAAFAALAVLLLVANTRETFTYTIAAAELLPVLVIAQPPRLLTARPLLTLGKWSYGIYLWHVPMMWAIGMPKTPTDIALLVAVSIAAGAVSHWGVERWFLKPRPETLATSPAAA
jgi:peptidoglycan/LPS O-acetylase OafA/YrhL